MVGSSQNLLSLQNHHIVGAGTGLTLEQKLSIVFNNHVREKYKMMISDMQMISGNIPDVVNWVQLQLSGKLFLQTTC